MSSAASSRSRRDAERLTSLVFFIDRSLGGRVIAEALRAVGARVETHDAHFDVDAPDVDWLAAVGKRGALRSASAKAFFLTQQGLTGEEMAQIFVTALPGMVTRAGRQPGPFIYTLSREGVFARVKLKP
jgi:hypothetical protein